MFFCLCSIFLVLSSFVTFSLQPLARCCHQCTFSAFRPGDIFSSVKVLYFFNNSQIGGIKLMFHAWRVERKKERRGEHDRNREKRGRKMAGGVLEKFVSRKVTHSTRTSVKGKRNFSPLPPKISFHLLIFL